MRTLVLTAVVLLCASTAPAAEKLNVLFIAVDDLRPELGCYGGKVISPNLDKLAARGMIFERAYCQQAVCSPSRTSLLTGRRPDTTKVYDLETHFRKNLPDVVTLPEFFKQNGYHTQSFGKIYHGSLDDPQSWSVPHTRNQANQYASAEIRADIKKRGGMVGEVGGRAKGPAWEIADVSSDSELPDGDIADKAIAAMREVKDKPFFLAVGFMKPHLPFVAPKRFFEKYPLESIELSPNPNTPADAPEVALTNFAELRGYSDMPKGKTPVTEQQAKELRRAYYASASFMDSQAGRVLDELDKLGLRENTIVILWGDHGWHLGDEGMWCKHTNFEVATRAALMISVPGMKHAGGKTAALVEFVDIYPSLVELAGMKLPDGLEGTSFAPLLDEPTCSWKPAAFSQYPRPNQKAMGYTMRTKKYRYTEWQSTEDKSVVARELYDHETDPLETRNIAGDQPHMVKDLSAQLADGWRAAQP